MSSIEPLSPGSELAPYRLVERLSSSVWKAEDTRGGKTVAVKVLTRQLPREANRREQVIRDVRLGSAIYHAFLVPIVDVVAAGDALLLVMDFLEVLSLSEYLDHQPRNRSEFFRIGYQVADAVKFLQARNMVHGNINGESVMIQPNGQVRLGGLNALNLVPRKEGTSSPVYQQKGNDPRSVAYMAPEQIAGQGVDFRADIFSLGVVLYEIATGALPWNATTAGDIARAVVEGQPQSPHARNPQIASDVMAAIGRCLFKDPYRRLKDARALVDDIAKADPDSMRFATELAKRATVAAPTVEAAAPTRSAILLLGDIVDYDRLYATKPDAAIQAAARMQQVLGEAVYLFDGTIADPFGPRVVGELPNVEAAIEAARKGEFDFAPEQQGENPIRVRLLLHAGEVAPKDSGIAGDCINRGFAALSQLPPFQLFISEDFVKKGRGNLRLKDAGARGGVKLYEIVPSEPAPQPQQTIAVETAIAEQAEQAAPPPPAIPRRSRAALWVSIGLFLLLAGVAGIVLTRRQGAKQVAQPVAAAKPVEHYPRTLVVDGFSAEGADPAMLERAQAIRLAALEILRNVPDLHVVDSPTPDAATLKAMIHAGAAGPEIVPTLSGMLSANGPAAPAPDIASGVQAVVGWIAAQAHVRAGSAAPEALNAFGEALTARENKDEAKFEASLRTATKADPNFLPAQLMAMSFFESKGNDADALAAAKQVFALAPDRIDAARKVATGSLSAGDVPTAIAAYRAVLKTQPNDAAALNTIGRYALAAGDSARVNAVLNRLKSVTANDRAIHDPDLLVYSGRIENAIDQYYNLEVDIPNNPALCLKIGRFAVLRHTLPIADIELGKLQKIDPFYGYPLLKAYVDAQQQARPEAAAQLTAARAGMKAGDDYWTCAAEVYAILGDTNTVFEALQKAADRHEPTMAYVLSDPLFTYLANDPRFQALRAKLVQQQQEVAAALAQAPI